jgi:hypothetical protein
MCLFLDQEAASELLPDARALWDDIMLDAPAFTPILSLVDRAFDISIQTRHNFYDCVYVALAEREGCELLTADAKLITTLQLSDVGTSLSRSPNDPIQIAPTTFRIGFGRPDLERPESTSARPSRLRPPPQPRRGHENGVMASAPYRHWGYV